MDNDELEDAPAPEQSILTPTTATQPCLPSSGPSQLSSSLPWAPDDSKFAKGDIVVIDEEIDEEIDEKIDESQKKCSKLSKFCQTLRNSDFPESKLFKFRDLHLQFDSFKDSNEETIPRLVKLYLYLTGLHWFLEQNGIVTENDAIEISKGFRVGTKLMKVRDEQVDFVWLFDDRCQLLAVAVLNQDEVNHINTINEILMEMRKPKMEITVQVILTLASEKQKLFREQKFPGSESAKIILSNLFTDLINVEQIEIEKVVISRSNSQNIQIQKPPKDFILELKDKDSVKILAHKKSQQSPTGQQTSQTQVIKPLCFEKQAEVAKRLFKRTVDILEDLSKFTCLKFLILTPNLNSLMEQTLERVEDWKFKSEYVVYKYYKNENCKQEQHEKCWNLIKEAKKEQNIKTLYVFIFDECHYANNPNGAHAQIVNDSELMKRENVFMLLVSATPWNVLSKNSRIPEFRHFKDDPQKCIQIVKRSTIKDSNNTMIRVCSFTDVTNNTTTDKDKFDDLEKNLLPGEDNVIEWWDWSANQSNQAESHSAQQPDEFEYISLNKLFRSIVSTQSSDRFIRQDDFFNKMIESFNSDKFGSRDHYLQLIDAFVKDNLTQISKKQDKFWTDELLLIDYLFSFLYFHFVRRCDPPEPKFDSQVLSDDELAEKIRPYAPNVEQVLKYKFDYERSTADPPPDLIHDPTHETVVENSAVFKNIDQADAFPSGVGIQFLKVFWKIIFGLNKKWKQEKFACNLEIVAKFYLNWVAGKREDESLFQMTETDKIVRTLLSSREIKIDDKTVRRGHMIVVRVVETKTGQIWHDCLDFLSRVLQWEKIFDVIDDFGQSNLKFKLDPFWFQMYFSHNPRTVSYEDLQLPCIIILVAKGRMGDTFPHSLRTIDLRLRHMNEGSTLSTVVQELGRLCRYVKKGEEVIPYALISKPLFEQLKKAITETTGKKKTRQTVHADRGIEYAQKKIKVDHNLYRIPGFDNDPKFTEALLTNEKLENHDGRVRKSFYRSIYSPSPSKSQIRKLGTSQSSYDKDNDKDPPETHPRRILLSAETQIGKTGAYLQFLHLLETKLSEISPVLGQTIKILAPKLPGKVSASDWKNPNWANWDKFGNPFSGYDEVKRGKYHPRVQLFRLRRLLEIASESKNSTCVVEQFATAIQFQEMIGSNEALEKLKNLGNDTQIGEPAVSTVSSIINEDKLKKYRFTVSHRSHLESLISWDGRHVLQFERSPLATPPQWNYTANGQSSLLLPEGGESLTSMIWGDTPQKPPISNLLIAAYEDVINFSETDTKSEEIQTTDQQKSLPKNYTADMRMGNEALQHSQPTISAKKKRTDVTMSRSYQGRDLTELFGENLIRVSIPEAVKNHFEFDEKTIRKFNTESSTRCIFIPSHNRPKKAKLHFQENMKLFLDKDSSACPSKPEDYIEFVVVRSGSQFVNYFNAWDNDEHIVFVQLPDKIDVNQLRKMFPEDSPNWFNNFAESNSPQEKKIPWEKRHPILQPTDGIGFARLAIQLFSHFLGMKQIWMLDDNIESFHQLSLEGTAPYQTPSPTKQPQWCSMLDVMKFVEDIFNHAQQDNIGIMGIRRHWRNYKFGSTPFSNTHKTYSFLFLNVEATIAKNVLYPPKEVWEDIEFAHLCHESGLLVVRCNKYFHDKYNFTPPNDQVLQDIEIVKLDASASVSPPPNDQYNQTRFNRHQERVEKWCCKKKIKIVKTVEDPIEPGVKACLLRPDRFDGQFYKQVNWLNDLKNSIEAKNNPQLEFLFQIKVQLKIKDLGELLSHSSLSPCSIKSTREKIPDSEDSFDCFIVLDFRHPKPPPILIDGASRSTQPAPQTPPDQMIDDLNSTLDPAQTSIPAQFADHFMDVEKNSSPRGTKRPLEGDTPPTPKTPKRTKSDPNSIPSSSAIATPSNQPNPPNSTQNVPSNTSSSVPSHSTPNPSSNQPLGSSSNNAPASRSADLSSLISPDGPLQLPAAVYYEKPHGKVEAKLILKEEYQNGDASQVCTCENFQLEFDFGEKHKGKCSISSSDIFKHFYESKQIPIPSEKDLPRVEFANWKVNIPGGSKPLEHWRGEGTKGVTYLKDGTWITVRVRKNPSNGRTSRSRTSTPQPATPRNSHTSTPQPATPRTPAQNPPSPFFPNK